MTRSVTTMVISRSRGAPRRECHHFRMPPTGRLGPVGVLDNVKPLTSPPPRAPQPINSRTTRRSESGEYNSLVASILPRTAALVQFGGRAGSGCPPLPSRPVNGARIRTVAAIAGRVLLGILVAVLLGGAVLLLLAYYADVSFDIEAVAVAILIAGLLVFLWT